MKQRSLASFFSGGMTKSKLTTTLEVKEEHVSDIEAKPKEAQPNTDSETGMSESADKVTVTAASRKARKRAIISDDESDASTNLDDCEQPKDQDSDASSNMDEVSAAAVKVAKKLSVKPQPKKAKVGPKTKVVSVEKTTFDTISTKDGKQVPFLAL
ncbi:hypothetical protein IWW43_003029, partial [Coemansia sp. RSA 1935]